MTAPANVSLSGVPTTAWGTLSMTADATESESSLDITFEYKAAASGTWSRSARPSRLLRT